ncbi:MAG: hypothetical protein WC627_03310 [Legionella sp.]|jgi:hypothetical protein
MEVLTDIDFYTAPRYSKKSPLDKPFNYSFHIKCMAGIVIVSSLIALFCFNPVAGWIGLGVVAAVAVGLFGFFKSQPHKPAEIIIANPDAALDF